MNRLIQRIHPVLPVAVDYPKQTALMVTCDIGVQQYGLPIAAVSEVVRLPALLSLAGAPPFLCGLLNLRGTYLPVLNGRILVGEPAVYDLSNQIIIAGYDQPAFGLLVDQVGGVQSWAPHKSKPLGKQSAAAFLQAVVTANDTSVVLFDVTALLALVPEK